jgi:hypothetical protein
MMFSTTCLPISGEIAAIIVGDYSADEYTYDVLVVGHTPRVLMQGRKKSRRRTPTRIPLYSY